MNLNGTANVSQITSAMQKLQAQLNALAAANAAAQRAAIGNGVANMKAFDDAQQRMRDGRRKMIATANGLGFSTRSVSLSAETDRFNEALAQNKLRAREAMRAIRDLRREESIAARSLAQQVALRNSSVADWGTDARGRRMGTLFTPQNLDPALTTASMRYAYINRMIQSAADNTIKWGKNTQWAGRQLMVGFTYPLAIIGAGTAMLAYQYEKEMARIVKVSEDSSAQIRANAQETAEFVAASYGKSAQETLKVMGDLAAIGYSGQQLTKMTEETQRISFLGDLNPEDATKTVTMLQTVYGMDPSRIKEAGDYMNALENSTSLTMDDFVRGGPRVAAIMEEMGVSFEQMGVLLNGFKSAGIDAQEGARALRSVAFRTIAPRGHVLETFEKNTGKNLKDIIRQYNGEFLPTFMAIGQELKNIDSVSRSEVIRVLFGVEQGSKALELMNQLVNSTGQMAQAWDVAGMSTKEWGDIADRELKAYQQSLSGRFDRALQTVKLQLVEVGRPFLELGVSILKGMKPVLDFFNGMDETTKRFAMAGVLITAALGPIIMLAGLFANAIGNVVKFGTTLYGLRNSIKIVNADQQASILLAQSATGAMNAQGGAALTLAQRIGILTAAIQRQAQAQGNLAATSAQVAAAQSSAAGAALVAAARGPAAAGGPLPIVAGGARPLPGSPTSVTGSLGPTVSQSNAIANNWQRGSAALATGAVAMGAIAMSQGQASEGAQKWSQIAIGVGLAATLLPGLLGGVGKLGGLIAQSTRGTRAIAAGFGRVTTAMGPLLGGALRLLGPIGIIAGGILLLKEVYDYMVRIKKQQDGINDSAENWAEIIGYDYKENAFGAADVETVLTKAQELDKVTEGLREKNKGLVDYAKGQKDNQEEMLRLAIQQAALVRNSGGTARDAEIAAESVLMAADVSRANIKEIMIDVQRINWDDPEQIASALQSNVQAYINKAMSVNDQGGKWFDPRDWFRDGRDLTQEAGVQATLAGQAFAEQFAIAANDPQAQYDLLVGMDERLETSTAKIMDRLRNQSKEAQEFFKGRGISGPQALLSQLEAETRAADDPAALDRLRYKGQLLNDVIDLTSEEKELLKDQAGLEKTAVRAIVENMGLTGDRAKNLVTMEGLQKHLGLTTEELAAKVREMNRALEASGQAAITAGNGMEWLAEIGQDAAAEMLPQARRDVMSTAQNFILEEAAYAHQNNFDNAMDALRARGEAELAKFEKDADALQQKYEDLNDQLEDKYDEETGWANARLRQIRDQIKAEEDAEKIRERIFEAERKRIQRMQELFSGNIDFNKALNEGNLDEAARVRSNMDATVAQWGIDDQQQNDPAQARIESLRQQEEAEEKALDRAKEREQEALKAAQEAEQAALDTAKKASQEKIKDRETAAQKMFEIEKRRLDRELAVLREFLPTNEAELNGWVGRVQGIYNNFGSGYLTQTAGWWGGLVGNGLQQGVEISTNRMKTEINWAQVGRDIANQITGVLGLDVNGFMEWMRTGMLPGSAMGSAGQGGARFSGGTYMGGRALHVGGPVSWSQKDRTGVPRTASLYPSEVPAILKRGEFVVNKKAAQNNLGLLHHINENKVPKEGQVLHTGGQVGVGGGSIVSGILGGIMGQLMNAMGQQISMGAAQLTGGGGGAMANMLGAAALGAILRGLRAQESGGDYKARSKISSASGAYQYIRSTWNNYGGYKEAWQAPPEVQDARAAADLMNAFRKYGNWEQAVASHFYPAWAGNQSKWGSAPGKGNPTVWDYVTGVLTKAGFGSMGGMIGGAFSAAGNWPAAVRGVVSGNTAAAAQYIRRAFGIENIGLLGNRPNKSDHPMGKAADFMIPNWNSPQGIALGNAIASFFIQNPNTFGTKYVIWRDMINSGSGWRPYTHPNGPTNNPTLQHRDHVHTSFKHLGGEVLPQLKKGGFTLSEGIANLHPGEAVLTAPLTQDIKDMARNAAGGGDTNITVTVNGSATPDEKREFERIVRGILDERDRRNGRNRKVG